VEGALKVGALLEIVLHSESLRLVEPASNVDLVVRDHARLVHVVVLPALEEERLVEAIQVDPRSLAVEDLTSLQVVFREGSRPAGVQMQLVACEVNEIHVSALVWDQRAKKMAKEWTARTARTAEDQAIAEG